MESVAGRRITALPMLGVVTVGGVATRVAEMGVGAEGIEKLSSSWV